VPPGAEHRFATVALRAAGGSGGSGIRWYVDGRHYAASRWELEQGTHRIRAVSGSGESAEATITVK
jgi:membrane carboxypeptidase/penicillin-binding protein PbpC